MFGALALLAPISFAQRQETGLVIQSWKYDPETKGLALKLVNLSGKDIIAYNVSYSDGSTDLLGRPNPPGEHSEDGLGWLIIAQMSGKEPDKDQPYGILAAGATRTLILGAKDTSVKAVVDLVVYTDSTAEVLNEHAFSQIVVMRKGSLMAMQKESEAIHRVLADAAITNPNAAAVEELKQELVEAKKLNNPEVAEGNRAVALQSAIADLERYQQPNFFSKKGTEREHLKEFAKYNETILEQQAAEAAEQAKEKQREQKQRSIFAAAVRELLRHGLNVSNCDANYELVREHLHWDERKDFNVENVIDAIKNAGLAFSPNDPQSVTQLDQQDRRAIYASIRPEAYWRPTF